VLAGAVTTDIDPKSERKDLDMSAESESPLFGPVERRLFRLTAIVFLCVLLAGLIGIIVWALAKALAVFHNLLLPLSVAGILALVLYPVVDFLQIRLRLPRAVVIAILLTGVAAVLVGCIVLLVPVVLAQAAEFAEAAPGILANWQESMARYMPRLSSWLAERLAEVDLSVILPRLDNTGKTIMSYVGLLVGIGFIPLFLFFTLLSGGQLRAQATELLSVLRPRTRRRALYFLDLFVAYVTTFFQGQLMIAVIMGAMYAVGFSLVGLKAGILIGIFLGLLNVVPFLGTLVGLLVVLPIAYFQGDGGLQLLSLALLVFTVVQVVESWFLTPKIMADRSGLHPVLVVISIFFWGIALGGISGMILAVPLTAFIVAIWKQMKAGLTRSLDPNEED
jgi:predicted PurR-regulated permease PerM